LDTISQTGADMSTAVIWSKSKPEVEFQYGGRLGEFNGMSSQSHVIHCMVKEFHCHIENRFSPYFIFLFFYCSLGFGERRLSYRFRYTCFFVYTVYMRAQATLDEYFYEEGADPIAMSLFV